MKEKTIHKKFSAMVSVALSALLICANYGVVALKAADMQEITPLNVTFIRPTQSNPLGSASDFNGVIFGNLSDFRDTEGPVASTGNVSVASQICAPTGSTYQSHQGGGWMLPDEIDNGVIQPMNVGLLLSGAGASSSCPVQNGVVVLGEESKYSSKDYSEIVRHAAADKYMTDMKNYMKTQNESLFAKASTGEIIRHAELQSNTKWPAMSRWGEVIVFKGTNAGWNIFDIDMSDASLAGAAWVYDVPANAGIMFNVTNSKGTEIVMTNGSNSYMQSAHIQARSYVVPFIGSSEANVKCATAELAGRVLWNIDPKITKITYKSGSNNIMGSVLAPNAAFESNSGDGSVNGTLVAKRAKGFNGSELHWFKFRGADEEDDTTEITTTAPITTTVPADTTTTSAVSVPDGTTVPGSTPPGGNNPPDKTIVPPVTTRVVPPHITIPANTTTQPQHTTTRTTTAPVTTATPSGTNGTTAPSATTTVPATKESDTGSVTTSVTTSPVNPPEMATGDITSNTPPIYTTAIDLGAGVDESSENGTGLMYMLIICVISTAGVLILRKTSKKNSR